MVCKQTSQRRTADKGNSQRRRNASSRNETPVVNVHIEREIQPGPPSNSYSPNSERRRTSDSSALNSSQSSNVMPENPLFYNCHVTFHVNHFLTNVKCGEPPQHDSPVRRKRETTHNHEPLNSVLGKRMKEDFLSGKNTPNNVAVKNETPIIMSERKHVAMEEEELDSSSMEEDERPSEGEEPTSSDDEEFHDKNFIVSDSDSENSGSEESGLETLQPNLKHRKLV
nr:unnamed protein product [Naegleria fowleri]